ncbi:TetR/AcrR family transcriptional regulator [Fodinicola feengrottensis]|uniref:TetR/AcrR family transcriptional regulator n=1 Tax=Fodinicola feengrottensis TaxID=435914 RepID=UPI002441C9A9|nr:helix-turn-helix domain containing protein [Fodinicola feengrottensis]
MTDFQRARRPEQIQARRAAILDVAAQLLTEHPIADISLRELSARVGLAKSNVLRYFDSREAIFLEILDRTQREWLDALEIALPQVRFGPGAYEREIALASAIADAAVGCPFAVRADQHDDRGVGAQHLDRLCPWLQAPGSGQQRPLRRARTGAGARAE